MKSSCGILELFMVGAVSFVVGLIIGHSLSCSRCGKCRKCDKCDDYNDDWDERYFEEYDCFEPDNEIE